MRYDSCLSSYIPDNVFNKYSDPGKRVGFPEDDGNREKGDIVTDIATSFVVLLAIFFPSCTGLYCSFTCSLQ